MLLKLHFAVGFKLTLPGCSISNTRFVGPEACTVGE